MMEGIWDILLPLPKKKTLHQSPVGCASVTTGSAWVGLIDTERASVWRVLALIKVKALKGPEQH
jgi:hypothetical protein